jgi:hypothetical protein
MKILFGSEMDLRRMKNEVKQIPILLLVTSYFGINSHDGIGVK